MPTELARRLEAAAEGRTEFNQRTSTGSFSDETERRDYVRHNISELVSAPEVGDSGGILGTGLGGVMSVLEGVDKGRAVLASTINQTARAISEGGYNDGGWDWGEWSADIGENTGFGDYVARRGGTGNIWGDRVVGFVGDVALDPLTYLTLGVGTAGKEFTRTGLARLAFTNGADDVGQQILRRGQSSLSAEQLTRLAEVSGEALEGGVRLTVPGTGRAARAVSGGRIQRQSVQVLPQSAVKFTPLGLYEKARGATTGTLSSRKLARLMGGDRRVVKDMIVTGTPRQARDAFLAIDASNAGRLVGRRYADEMERAWASLADDLARSGVDGRQAYDALGGADVDMPPALLARLRLFADQVADQANEMAGEVFITKRDNWQPAVRSQELVEHLRSSGRRASNPRNGFNPAGFEKQAGIVAGGEFMGETLVEAAQHPENWTPRKQAQRILEDAIGQHGDAQVFSMFDEDLFTAMPAQLRSVAQRVGFKHAETRMAAEGIIVDAFRTVPDAGSAVDENSVNILARRLERLKDRARRSEARVAATQAAADRAAARAVTVAEEGAESVRAADEAIRNAAVGTSHQSPDGLIEYASVLEQQAVGASRAVQTALRNIDEVQSAAGLKQLEEAAAESFTNMERIQGHLRQLERERDELWRKSVTATEVAGKRLSDATERLELQDRIDEIGEYIAEAEANIAVAGRPAAEIQGDLAGVSAQRARVSEVGDRILDYLTLDATQDTSVQNIVRLQTAAGVESRADATKKLEFVRRQLRGLEQTEASLRGELDRAGRAGADSTPDLDTARAVYQAEFQRLTELGEDALADQVALLNQRVPKAGVPFVHADGDVWFHGVPSDGPLDLTRTVDISTRPMGTPDDLFGVHLSSVSEHAASGLGGDTARVARLQVMMENPKAYAAVGDETGRGLLREDMLRSAVDQGVVSADSFGDARWVDAIASYEAGVPFRDAVASAFPNENPLDVAARFSQVDVLGADTVRAVHDGFLAQLRADGFDGVTYGVRDGGDWFAAPVDAAQVAAPSAGLQGGTHDLLVRDYKQLRDDMTLRLMRTQQVMVDQAEAVGVRVDRMGGQVTDARITARENREALSEVQSRLAVELHSKRGVLRESLANEFQLRQRIDGVYEQAAEIQAEADRLRAVSTQEAQDLAVAARVRAESDVLAAEAQAGRLQAAADQAALDLEATGKELMSAEQAVAKLRNPATVDQIVRNVIPDGFKELGTSRYGPEFIVDGLQEASKLMSPEGMRSALKAFDHVTNLFKGYAIMTPGFHSRNVMGGVFNNWMAGVEVGAYRHYRRMSKPYYREMRRSGNHERALRALSRANPSDPDGVAAFTQIIETGVLTGGQSTDLARYSAGRGTLNPFSLNNKLLKANRRGVTFGARNGRAGVHVPAAESAENYVRGALALDTMSRGGSIDDAIDNVFKYQFDYDDLSTFERSVARRVIPFYTWTRKNLPLQIEGFLTNPKAYTRFLAAKRNLEMGVEEESVVPSWFGETLSIHTPFSIGGSDVYLMPDLPFRDITRTLDPKFITNPSNILNPSQNPYLGSANPILKTPLELWAGQRFFNDIPFREGYQPVPASWGPIANALELVGQATRNADGEIVTSDKTLYTMEQFMPLLARARRALPSEEIYEQRLTSTAMSMLFGIGTRANTPRDQANELYRRQLELMESQRRLTDLGFDADPEVSDLISRLANAREALGDD